LPPYAVNTWGSYAHKHSNPNNSIFFTSQTGMTIVQCFANRLSSEYSTTRWWLLTCTGPGNNLLTWYVYPRREECSQYFCSLLMLLSLAVSHPLLL